MSTGQWRLVLAGKQLMDTHVVPVADFREHDYSLRCWCQPTPDVEYPHIHIHHSLDRREEYERGERKMS